MQSDIPTVSIPGPEILPLFSEAFHWLKALYPPLFYFAKDAIVFLVVASIPISLFFLIGIIYCVEKLKVIKKEYEKKHDTKIEPAFEEVKGQKGDDLTARWQKTHSLLNSDNPNDWKQAILEADTMLLDVLEGLGYQGDGVGEKLKRVSPGEMKSLRDAWDAHMVRNTIAHEAGYQLDHHTATQTMAKYRKVFQEFYYI